MGDVGEIRVRHLGTYFISPCRQLHSASSPEYVASFGSGNLADVAIGIFHKTYLHGMVVVGSAYEAYAVASERAGVKLDADVKVLASGRTESLSCRLAWVEGDDTFLIAFFSRLIVGGKHHSRAFLQLHHSPRAFSPIHSLGISPRRAGVVSLPVVIHCVLGFMAIQCPSSRDDVRLYLHGKWWQLQGEGLCGSGQDEGLAVERAILHCAKMSRVGTLAPFDFQFGVVACPSAILQCHGSAYLIKILYARGLAMYIAITEYRSHLMVCGIKWFAAE